MKKLLLFVFLLTLSSQALAQPWACCDVLPAKMALARADVVFSGRVKDFVAIRGHKEAIVIVSFEVFRYWKGNVPSLISVFTIFNEKDEGFEFQKSKEYVVFARKEKIPGLFGSGVNLRTGVCSGTILLSKARGDWDFYLGPSKFPRR